MSKLQDKSQLNKLEDGTQYYEKYIQGDVILYRVPKLQEGMSEITQELKQGKAGIVLQYSEMTGHHHHFKGASTNVRVFTNKELAKDKTITPDTRKFLSIGAGGEILYHGKGFQPQPSKTGSGDHDMLKLPEGDYIVKITRTYDYEKEEEALVVD